MKPTILRPVLFVAALAGVAALAACHSATNESVETNVSNLEVTVNDTNATTDLNVATPAPVTNATTSAPTAPGNDFDMTRTQDDADATGMTARTSQDDGNSGTPAQ